MQPQDLGETLWILKIDGSSPRAIEGGADMALKSSKGFSISQVVKFAFAASNNEAKYKVGLLELRLVKELSVANFELRCDSQLVASQLRGEYKTRNDRMEQYLKLDQSLMVGFTQFIVA